MRVPATRLPTSSRGLQAPKGACHWLSPHGRRVVRVALKFNFTEWRVESFADDLNTRRGIVSGRVALLPRSTEIQPRVAPIRPSSHPKYVPPYTLHPMTHTTDQTMPLTPGTPRRKKRSEVEYI